MLGSRLLQEFTGQLQLKLRSTLEKSTKHEYMGLSQNLGYNFGGAHNKDCSISGSLLGCPYLGNYYMKMGSQIKARQHCRIYGLRLRKPAQLCCVHTPEILTPQKGRESLASCKPRMSQAMYFLGHVLWLRLSKCRDDIMGWGSEARGMPFGDTLLDCRPKVQVGVKHIWEF